MMATTQQTTRHGTRIRRVPLGNGDGRHYNDDVAEQFMIQVPRAKGPAASVSAREYPAAAPALGATLILGHGAGAPQSSRWMVQTAHNLATRGLDVVTFNFSYTEEGRKVPDRTEVLEATYIAVIQAVRQRPSFGSNWLFIGGKSMGGRMASHVASKWDKAAGGPGGPLAGLVFFGYPLHPPGKPDQLRDAHLPAVRAPMLFLQGTRDAFGTPVELGPVLAKLPVAATLSVVEGGDHSFTVAKSWPVKQPQIDAGVTDAVIAWIKQSARNA
jgi:predicted alpha/beta-hydrolase family hydrolase